MHDVVCHALSSSAVTIEYTKESRVMIVASKVFHHNTSILVDLLRYQCDDLGLYIGREK